MKRINLGVIISILIIIILVAFILAYNIFGLGTLVNNGIHATSSLSSQVKNDVNTGVCPSEIIPEEINLTKDLDIGAIGDTNFGQEVYGSRGFWADGQKMEVLNYSTYPLNMCHKGQSEGENINLIYCNGLSYSKSVTPTSKEGIIGKTQTISYSINLVLQKESETYAIQTRPPLDEIMTNETLYTYKIISSVCIKQ